MHLLKRVLTAVVLIPIVVVLVLRAPIAVVALVTALVALLAVQEFLHLAEGYGHPALALADLHFRGAFFSLLLAIATGLDTPLLSTAVFIYSVGFAAAIAPFLF